MPRGRRTALHQRIVAAERTSSGRRSAAMFPAKPSPIRRRSRGHLLLQPTEARARSTSPSRSSSVTRVHRLGGLQHHAQQPRQEGVQVLRAERRLGDAVERHQRALARPGVAGDGGGHRLVERLVEALQLPQQHLRVPRLPRAPGARRRAAGRTRAAARTRWTTCSRSKPTSSRSSACSSGDSASERRRSRCGRPPPRPPCGRAAAADGPAAGDGTAGRVHGMSAPRAPTPRGSARAAPG